MMSSCVFSGDGGVYRILFGRWFDNGGNIIVIFMCLIYLHSFLSHLILCIWWGGGSGQSLWYEMRGTHDEWDILHRCG